ncbi:beta strand repeat-containing protein [Neosynechococcus sphagnicola]|uniref:beta strand repeat-containing protein n=1 Tax=Neosynechococcus sphagnicola TaxID=1501145 RepID=UPI0019554144|nr:hypothetical protein [Neosynechococcus sphagnicola]
MQLTGSGVTVPTQTGTTLVAGQVDVSGQQGGRVALLGQQVGLVGATVNASGGNGGGTVLVGGDYLGQGTIPNAAFTFVSPDSTLRADALSGGNGGKVIVWADQATRFYGTITAQGGAESGNGGFVETSGKQFLEVIGATVDTSARLGQVGTWLLDPFDLTISVSGDQNVTGLTTGPLFTPSSSPSNLNVTTLENALVVNDVTVSANKIDVLDSINFTGASDRTLTLNAAGEIEVQDGVSITSSIAALNLAFNANDSIKLNGSSSGISINTNGGSVQLLADADSSSGGALSITHAFILTGGADFVGFGTGDSNFSNGITITNSTLNTGSGHIFLTGNGFTSGSGNGNIGIKLDNSALITTGSGTINLTGIGGDGSGDQNYGILLQNSAQIIASGDGVITLNGTGGNGINDNYGVFLDGSTTSISANSGDITITGIGNGTGTNNYGILLQNGADISESGTGNLTLNGTGGNGTSSNVGILLFGAGTSVSSSGSGTMQLLGIGQGNSTTNIGVAILGGASVFASGSGSTLLDGTGGSGGTANHGVLLQGPTTSIQVTNGSLSIQGVANGSGSSQGIRIDSGVTISAIGSGDIDLQGTGAGISDGIFSTGSGNLIGGGSATGNISLTADRLTLDNVTVQGSGTLLIQPLSQSTSIGVGSGSSGTLNLNTTELANLVDGFTSITIGRSDSSGAMNIGTATLQDNLKLQTPSGGTMTFTGTLDLGGNNLTLKSGGTVTQSAGAIANVNGLELIGTGSYSLTSSTNDVNTLVANTNAVSFRDLDDLTIGTVGSTTGITTSNDSVNLQVGTNLAIDAPINLGNGNLTLNVGSGVSQTLSIVANGLELLGSGATYNLTGTNIINTLAGDIAALNFNNIASFTIGTVNSTNGLRVSGTTQLTSTSAVSQTQAVITPDLELLGSGSFTLTNGANDIDILASNTIGGVSFSDVDDLTIGSVLSASGMTTSNSDVSLQVGTTLTINAPISLGSGNLTLQVGTATTQDAATSESSGGAITAAGLVLLGNGSYDLWNSANDVSTLAANTNNLIHFTDQNGFNIGTVNTTNGVTTTGNLVLDAGGAVTQTQAIAAAGLGLLGSGSYTLENTANNVTTLAADTTGAISYIDADGLTIGSVNPTGITSTSGFYSYPHGQSHPGCPNCHYGNGDTLGSRSGQCLLK